MKFDIFVVDCPWSFSDGLTMSSTKRGAKSNYQTLSIDDLKALPVKDLANPNGALIALWVPSSLLQEGLNVMKAWGFQQKQTYVWVKNKKEPFKSAISTLVDHMEGAIEDIEKIGIRKYIKNNIQDIALNNILGFGMGHTFRQSHEIALIGINNTGIYKKLQNKSQRSVSFGQNEGHSIKPEHLQDSLDIMFDGEKIELFARRERKGWTCLGNEVGTKEDIRVSLSKMIEDAGQSIIAQ